MTTTWYAMRSNPQARNEEDGAMAYKRSSECATELEAIEACAGLLRHEAHSLAGLGFGMGLALELAELAGAVAGHVPPKGDTAGGGVTDSSGVRWSWYANVRP